MFLGLDGSDNFSEEENKNIADHFIPHQKIILDLEPLDNIKNTLCSLFNQSKQSSPIPG